MKKNNVAGHWNLISGYLDNYGQRINILGPHPAGMVIFTEDLHFMVIVHNTVHVETPCWRLYMNADSAYSVMLKSFWHQACCS